MTKFFFSPIKDKETVNAGKKLKKNGFHQNIIYMSNPSLQREFINNVQNNDVVEFHADGLPWIAGGITYNEKTDYNPFTLAEYFSNLLVNKDIQLTIDLRFCTSGVYAIGPYGTLNFAEDFSKALFDHGYDNITVLGYSGYVNSKDPFRQSLCEVGDSKIHGSKIKHCRLDEGQLIFSNGILIRPAQKTLVSNYKYDESTYLKNSTLRKYLDDRNDLPVPILVEDMHQDQDFPSELQQTASLLTATDEDSDSETRMCIESRPSTPDSPPLLTFMFGSQPVLRGFEGIALSDPEDKNLKGQSSAPLLR